ncbi:MAG: hypothetical protein JWO60_807, partial [Frankiales bacterium]|nr:hypothetical protein [Frankiales bacterium]
MTPFDHATAAGAELGALAAAGSGAREVAQALDAQGRSLQRVLEDLADAAGTSPRRACAAAARELPLLLLTAARVGGTLADGADAQHRLL